MEMVIIKETYQGNIFVQTGSVWICKKDIDEIKSGQEVRVMGIKIFPETSDIEEIVYKRVNSSNESLWNKPLPSFTKSFKEKRRLPKMVNRAIGQYNGINSALILILAIVSVSLLVYSIFVE